MKSHSVIPRPISRRLFSLALIIAIALPLGSVSGHTSNAAPARFADRSFQQLWEYTDAPVAAGQVQRSWYWGHEPGSAQNEPYTGSKSGTRLVQYFDKARMEINNPHGDRNSQWFVT